MLVKNATAFVATLRCALASLLKLALLSTRRTLRKPTFGRSALSHAALLVLGDIMASDPTKKRALTLHDWEAKHYVAAVVIILLVMGLFAYSWS
jgi:hypothetical protein